MIITIIGKESINSVALPKKIRGQYWLYDSIGSNARRIISVEGINNEWVLKSNKNFKVIDSSNNVLKNTMLRPLSIYILKCNDRGRVFAFTEPVTTDRQMFTKYLFKGDIELKIGRGDQNDIVYSNNFTSSNHAVLSFSAGKWFIVDAGSTNGTFVNEKRVTKSELKIGDSIFIMGLKIVIGKSFIAINNPDGKVDIKTQQLQQFINQEVVESEDEDYEAPTVDYFSRAPRFKRDIKTAEFKIDTPPQSPLTQEMPWLLIMGSSMAMGIMSLVTLISAIISFNIVSMVMGASMLLGTVLLPSISKKYERKQKEKKEQLRQKRYKEYLDQISIKINEECQKQESILRENYLPVNACISRINEVESNLWERGFGQNDFLNIRLGLGESKLVAHMVYSERKFTIDEDNLQEELYTLCEAPKKLKNVPITVSLFDNYITGFIGSDANRETIAKSIIFQICSYYSYDEVKFVFLMDGNDSNKFDFVRWLPHVWSDDREFRFIAHNYDEVKGLSSYFEKDIEYRSSKNDGELLDITPYYVVFAFSEKLSKSAEFIKQLYSQKANLNFSVVNFANSFKNLPKECSNVVEIISESEGRIFDRNGNLEEIVTFVPDKFDCTTPDVLSKKLANVFLDLENQKYTLPKMLTFLDMYSVGKIDHLNPLTRWNENDPTLSLAVPVGVDTSGRLFKLDLHEKYHGPHGLVAGMTGSGKSEFIITYILSMAVNYHPDEVAFILIDYKGGGLAGAFVDPERGTKLPHIAGTITNLDGASINRSLISIQSELRRRQAIFNTARKVSNEGTIDIYKYQKLYRRGLVSEPLPHLFIISDEFAELKTQQPEFMDQLISAARIGRSLGVHLILATQKPNGVVDDQIWSNSRFRVCLKVQEKADSMDMIKRPDAASLADTGRFYLQVGFNEFFDLGQSAWCGAPYSPSDKVKEKYDNSVRFIDNLGRTITEVKPKDKNLTGAEVKQIVAMVKYLSDIADEEHISVKPLWLDPIPEKVYVEDLSFKYSFESEAYVLNPILGEYDDPFNQSQHIMTLPISQDGHAILYGSTGSGTETAIETMVYSIIRSHNADEVNMYILDFGAETLGAFRKAPQIGDVLFSSDEEKISNLFKMLHKEADKRKKMFSEYGGSYSSYIGKSKEKIPNIVVIINNFAVFAELFEQQEEELASLTRECQKYGMYFIISATAGNAVRYRLQQNFKQLIVLQMNDPSDYVGILGQTDGVCPSRIHGRGIVKYDKVYEFQTAYAASDDDLMEFYRNYSLELFNKAEIFAHKVPILPDVVDMEFVASEISDLKSVPVGVNRHNLLINKVNLSDKVVSMVLSEDTSIMSDFASSIATVLGKIESDVKVIDVLNLIPEGQYELIRDGVDEFIVDVFNDLVQRNNLYKDAGSDASVLSDYPENVILLFGLKQLFEQLMDDTADKLKVLLEKAELEYKVHFIVFDEVSSISSYSFQAWYKKQVSTNEGIWIGNGIYDQYALKLNRSISSSEDIDSDFGYVVSRGRETLVKLLNMQKADAEGYNNE